MNVIVSNKYQSLLATLEIDVIKSLNGEFEVDELISTFENFFFNKMILDITAIKGYKDITNLQKLSMSFDMNKVILLLDDTEESGSSLYLSQLISMGIYNFTRNKEGIMYLYDHANTYRDVAHIHQLKELTDTVTERIVQDKVNIIGVKDMTDHAGATTLIYMLKRQLENNYAVVAIEVDKRDFVYFNDRSMISTTKETLSAELSKHNDANVILVDLNSYDNEGICDDVLYLIEPTTIRLNKMIMKDRKVFDKLKGKKIVLNKSLLDAKDILDFEYESKSKIFYSVPPLDEKKKDHPILDVFLTKLGFGRQKIDENKEKSKILGLFKF